MISIVKWDQATREQILSRQTGAANVSKEVAAILSNVRKSGDEVLREYGHRFDGVMVSNLEVSEAEKESAMEAVDKDVLGVLQEAAENIRFFHQKQVREGFLVTKRNGVVMGQRMLPIQRVGMYVPGGSAAYPSTVLMDAIPAVIAGVEELIMVSPPNKNGSLRAELIAAAQIAGVKRIFKCGGAQAIAALAYGTETIPKVDKIVGPGNVYVAEAKKQVFGQTGIDMIAGPSEVVVLADESANPRLVAADLLAQAEHDEDACAILITTSLELAEQVDQELDEQVQELPRRNIAKESLLKNGKLILVDSIAEGVEISNLLAPEHLEVCTKDPFDWLESIKHAGSVFLGTNSPEPMGDYFTGLNHTLPTMGSARYDSPLSVDDFVKKMQFSYYPKGALEADYQKVALLARCEGLEAHARSVEARFQEEQS